MYLESLVSRTPLRSCEEKVMPSDRELGIMFGCRLDLARTNLQSLEAEENPAGQSIVIDLDGIPLLYLSDLSRLVDFYRQAFARGISVTLEGCSAAVRKKLKSTKLDSVFVLKEDETLKEKDDD